MNETSTPQSALPTAPLAQGSHKEARTPELIGAEIRMYVDAGRRVTLLCGIEIGRRLVEAKDLLKHGEWLPWLERETTFSDRQAQRYMKVFNEYGAAQLGLFGPETNATTLSDLPISKALALLSVPESEREDFAAEVDAEAISVKELEKAIAEKKAAEERAAALEKEFDLLMQAHEQEAKDVEDLDRLRAEAEAKARKWEETAGSYASQANDLQNDLRDAQKQIHELETRPQPVAVERDEKAIEEAVQAARAKAEAEAAEKIGVLQKKLEKAENARDKLKDAADKAEAGAAEKIAAAEKETEKARQELEAAKKELKASNGKVAAFGVYFKSVQENVNSMMEKVREIGEEDPETARKLCGAARVILNKAIERLETEV